VPINNLTATSKFVYDKFKYMWPLIEMEVMLMYLKNKLLSIFLNVLPIILMIALIPIVKNDYVLTAIYLLIIILSFVVKYNSKEYAFFIFGFIIMFFSEAIFISTGVETFVRNSLFGLMPFWLPFLWAYVFVVMRRVIIILDM
jgi:hypothetical protein